MGKLLKLIIYKILIAGLFHESLEVECNDPYPLDEAAFKNRELNYFDGSKCLRECDGKPMMCYYKLRIEPYSTMGIACGDCPRNKTACYNPQCVTGDGVEKGILVYNRQLPGPSIEVCKGDKVVVDVVNADAHRSSSVHWHGIRQWGTPHSDGVPMVTQCPINPGQTFRYAFYATDPGSFFYHSHSGVQKVDGLAGPLIVRDQRCKEPYGNLYDYDLSEHVCSIQDWIHILADEKIPGITRGPESGSTPKSYLINGRGIYPGSTTDPQQFISQVNSSTQPPITEFKVKYGKRYRFRIISSACLACTLKLTIQGHNMTVIYADGASPVNPQTVDAISLNSADRFDVILHANKVIDSYWILVRGEGNCKDAQQLAILRYEGSNPMPSSNLPLNLPNGITLNPPNPTCELNQDLCITELSSPYSTPARILQGKADTTLVLTLGFHLYSVKELFQSGTYLPFFVPANPFMARGLISGITNKLPSSPLLSQYKDDFCSESCYKNSSLGCICQNVYKVKLNALVDFIVTDSATHSANGLSHPFHLHGHNFYVLKEGIFNSTNPTAEIEQLKRWLREKRKNTNIVQKDVIGIPSGGYVLLRFIADNPGIWIFHCHFAMHNDLGMSGILQVGTQSQMVKTPPNFPTCGDFLPPL